MRLNDAAKVGLTTLVAAGLLVWVMLALRGPLGRGKSYLQKVSFTDARGIQEGAPVRVRGVDVGQVHEVGLGSRGNAEVTLRVTDDYDIRADDLIQIVGGALGFGQPYVEILPGGRKNKDKPGPDNVLTGETGPGTETIISRSEELLNNLNGLVGRLNRLTEGFAKTAEDPRIRNSLSRTVTNFEQISRSGVKMARNLEGTTADANRLVNGFERTAQQLDRTLRQTERLMAEFRGTATESQGLMRDARQVMKDTNSVVQDAGALVRNTNSVVAKGGDLVGDLRGVLGENRERLQGLFTNLDGSLKQLNQTLEETRSFIADPELRADLKTTASNVRSATENLKVITQDFRGVTSDPRVQEDLKATLTNLRDASQEAAETFRRVRGVLGGKGSSTIRGVGRALSGTEFRTDATYGAESGRARFDLDATVPWSDNTFYRLGLLDFGETTRINAQAGQRLAPSVWGRFGIHGSKLGLGLDVGRPARPPLTLDLYGVNNPRLDARGYLPIGRSLDVTIGVDNVFRRPDPVFGLRYRR